jgi:DNA (cytosine-5)-methyltransferase 1
VSQSNNHVTAELTFAEFFAGAGMARAGLGDSWRCVFANEIDRIKSVSYIANWGGEQLRVCDVADLKPSDLPPILAAWASPPCQDVSLAGDRGGLDGARSGAFWPWWRLMQGLRAPLLVIENVTGLLTSHEGRDFDAICDALTDVGYRFGTAIIDAALFVPQSRPRLFIVAADADVHIPAELIGGVPIAPFYPLALVAACKRQRSTLIWWSLPNPPKRNTTFADILEDEPKGVLWHSRAETDRLIGMMAPAHVAKVEAAKSSCKRMVGALYKRIRAGEDGIRRQRAEVRFDDIAGCLRMPTGGSSRQTIVIVEGAAVRSRLLSPREAARLTGLPEDYRLPSNYNEAYGLAADGVVVPVVRHLAEHILGPILRAQRDQADSAEPIAAQGRDQRRRETHG